MHPKLEYVWTRSLIHHNSPHAFVIVSNIFRLRSRFRHQQTFYILICCAVDGFQLQTIHFFMWLLLRFLFFIIWLFLFLVFFPISLNAADFIYLPNSMSESISMKNHWNINQIAYIRICQKSFEWSANVGIVRILLLFLYLVLLILLRLIFKEKKMMRTSQRYSNINQIKPINILNEMARR